MGLEHSSQQKPTKKTPSVQRGHTIATCDVEQNDSANNSPDTSVCSDSEYISYTVGRPIGDSPKATKSVKKPCEKKTAPRPLTKGKQAHDIVVVKEAKVAPDFSYEAMKRLHDIPQFLPIMHGSGGFTNVKDPAVLSRLDYKPFHQLSLRYQAHLAACAQPLATEQNALTAKVKELEMDIVRLNAQMVERQRLNARNTERLSHVRELKHNLSRCHTLLRQNLEDVQELNMMLPEEFRLEPFEWKPQS